MSLPIPFGKYIPRIFNRDSKLTALTDKVDSHLEEGLQDIKDLSALHDPARCPAAFLNELGYWLSANLKNYDSERERREKIYTAIQGHKRRGSWTLDAKPKVDAIAGGDSSLFSIVGGDEWILTGDGLTPSAYYWGTLGVDGIDDDLGLYLMGDFTEVEIEGIIYIDVDNNSLSTAEVNQIKEELADVVPAYFRVYLGYVDGAGDYIKYDYM